VLQKFYWLPPSWIDGCECGVYPLPPLFPFFYLLFSTNNSRKTGPFMRASQWPLLSCMDGIIKAPCRSWRGTDSTSSAQITLPSLRAQRMCSQNPAVQSNLTTAPSLFQPRCAGHFRLRRIFPGLITSQGLAFSQMMCDLKGTRFCEYAKPVVIITLLSFNFIVRGKSNSR